ncbi:MAG: DNA topoisomerase I [Candidatus Desulfovibrio kirbyi]|uniref:DNA topoisomerase 1 n=1 Tax=Candidatus Desulfovibrio kirbyi TaxID=2696086 RepID=A0A6L2R440_9BACT|nr:MAG: DNA topoisomerase I [Candidatus Desulfovibrio kirbyi]
MGKQLIIVESPAKVKTIKKFLGTHYAVHASIGHVRDLPVKTLGVDEARDFAPCYEIIETKKRVVNELREAAAKADTVYLAPDPDREGEAIAWHIAELIRDKTKNIKRIQFNEITSKAVREALEHPRELNGHLFDAQQARRVLDRLVGYKISPLLWQTVKRGISAGRVQSVALRLIVDREVAREAFVPEEYWSFKALLGAESPPPFTAEFVKINGKKAVIANKGQADALETSLKGKPFVVNIVEEKERMRAPKPPFITSTLQQAANQRHSYPAKRTMSIAQRLYEGVELGERGLTALITYMRTDSTRIADEAREATRAFITATYGKDYLPEKARVHKTRQGAQDAHEAIRPVDVAVTPEMAKDYLPPDQYNLYRLIWTRFVASQMAGARFHDTVATIDCAATQWRAKGERLLFPGFLAAQPLGHGDKDEASAELPQLKAGQPLSLEGLFREQKFTQPLSRFSEASFVSELEKLGIGRPSTYASIIATLQDREYACLTERHFVPTDLGRAVCGQLVEHFANLMDVGFTAQMEGNLDKVAEGGRQWVDVLRAFVEQFNPALEAASKNMKSLKGGTPSGLVCPECGKNLLIRFGKAGSFLACSGYPQCRHTSNFARTEDGKVHAVAQGKPPQQKIGDCPLCGNDLVVKKSRIGSRFIACTGYPQCTHTAPFSTGVVCPRCATGALVEKSSKRGKLFYSCDRYPQCDFALWGKPVPRPCPLCGSSYLVEKKRRDGVKIVCPGKGCGYSEDSGE